MDSTRLLSQLIQPELSHRWPAARLAGTRHSHLLFLSAPQPDVGRCYFHTLKFTASSRYIQPSFPIPSCTSAPSLDHSPNPGPIALPSTWFHIHQSSRKPCDRGGPPSPSPHCLCAVATAAPVLQPLVPPAPPTFSTAVYTYGFDVASPNATQLAALLTKARSLASAGYDTIILAFIHVRTDGVLVYNNNNLTSSTGTLLPAYSDLPQIVGALKSQGATVRFSVGGWCNDGDWIATRDNFNTVTANLDSLFGQIKVDGIDLDPEPCVTPLSAYETTLGCLAQWAYSNSWSITAAPFNNSDVWARVVTAARVPATGKQIFSNLNAQIYGFYEVLGNLTRDLTALGPKTTGVENVAKFLWPGWAPCEEGNWNLQAGPRCGYVTGRSATRVRLAVASILAGYPGTGGAFLWNADEWPDPKAGCPADAAAMRGALMKAAAKPSAKGADALCTPLGPGMRFATPYYVMCPVQTPNVPSGGVDDLRPPAWLVRDLNTSNLVCVLDADPDTRAVLWMRPVAYHLRSDCPPGSQDVVGCQPGPGKGQGVIFDSYTTINGTFVRKLAGTNQKTGALMLPATQGPAPADFSAMAFDLYEGHGGANTGGRAVRMRLEGGTSRPWCRAIDDGEGTVLCDSKSKYSTFFMDPVVNDAMPGAQLLPEGLFGPSSLDEVVALRRQRQREGEKWRL